MRRLSFSLLAVLLVCGPAAAQSSAGVKLTEVEEEILRLTNKARKEHNVPPLTANAILTKAARQHSENMAKHKKMDHVLDGKTPADRVKAAGYKYRSTGENVAYSRGRYSVQKIFDGWMNSEGHRKNILSASYSEIGIGMASVDDLKYYTQVFGRPR